MIQIIATVFACSIVLWFLFGYVGFGMLKYHAINVSSKLFGGGWNGGARYSATIILLMGPFGLYSAISMLRGIREEYGKDKVPMGFRL
jgi:hypothetical protein